MQNGDLLCTFMSKEDKELFLSTLPGKIVEDNYDLDPCSVVVRMSDRSATMEHPGADGLQWFETSWYEGGWDE